MTVKCVVPSISEDKIVDIIKQKTENYKIESRLINNKEVKLGNFISLTSKSTSHRKQFKAVLEIVDSSRLEVEPQIPKYGFLITEILHVVIKHNNREIEKKDLNIIYKITCPSLDNYCYPLIYTSDKWIPLKTFEFENDMIKISNGDWKMIVIVKEAPNDILNITPYGGLLYSKLDPLISIRISKGIFKETTECKISICDMPINNLDQFKINYEDQLLCFLKISYMFTVEVLHADPSDNLGATPFRRAISIKIPLPDWVMTLLEEQNFDSKTVIRDQKKEKIGFYFLQKINGDWNFVESNLKFTSNSLEFDSKFFGSFIFVKCRENREIKLCQNLILLENLIYADSGVILTFLWTKTQNWYIWIEVVPVRKIKETRSKFESMGFVYIEQSYVTLREKERNTRNRKVSKTEVTQKKTFELIENMQFKVTITGELERSETLKEKHYKMSGNSDNDKNDAVALNDEKTDLIDVDKIGSRKNKDPSSDEDSKSKTVDIDFTYHKYMNSFNSFVLAVNHEKRSPSEWETIVLSKLSKQSVSENSDHSGGQDSLISENNKIQSDIDDQFLEPSEESKKFTRLTGEEKKVSFFSELLVENINQQYFAVPKQIFQFYISANQMKEYFDFKTPEEKEKEKEKEVLKEEHEEVVVKVPLIPENRRTRAKVIPVEQKPKQVNYNRLIGLAKARVTANVIEREPKVISRRSFIALSTIVRQGLKLAVYLSIPDSAIAGIGFDALSQMSMSNTNNTTYKVLVLWKKMIMLNKVKESDYVEQLVLGLKSIGYEQIGDLVYRHWIDHQEISVQDCERCLLQNIF